MTILQQLTELSKPYLFVPVEGFENYYINENGDVFSSKRSPVIKMKPKLNKGYNMAYVCTHSKHSTLKVHRMVAMAFIPNPNNYPQVNHIDGVKTNNHISNLEWCNSSHNLKHAFRTGLRKHSEKSIAAFKEMARRSYMGRNTKKVIDINTGEIFSSIKIAAERIGVAHNCLSRRLSGVRVNNTSLRYA